MATLKVVGLGFLGAILAIGAWIALDVAGVVPAGSHQQGDDFRQRVQSGVPPKTIRYYESMALIPSADWRANGYRTYSVIDMHTLNFIKRARSLGFSVDEVRGLLDLWRDRRRSSAKVKALTAEHLKALDQKIAELRSMREHARRPSRAVPGR